MFVNQMCIKSQIVRCNAFFSATSSFLSSSTFLIANFKQAVKTVNTKIYHT